MEKRFHLKAIVIPITLSILTLSSCSLKQSPTTPNTVTVNGIGTVNLTTDSVCLKIKVETRNAEMLTAVKEHETKLSNLFKVLNEKGVFSENIESQGYEVVFEDAHVSGRFYIQAQYAVKDQIIIRANKSINISDIVSSALNAGATSFDSAIYYVSENARQNAVKEARKLAIEKAEESATILASSNALLVGQVLDIKESITGTTYKNIYAADDAKDRLVEVSVMTTYELKQ